MYQMATKSQHAHRYRRVPKLLLVLREEAELTQRALGAKLGKPQSWIYNCETGNRRVDLAEFCDWAAACGVDPVTAVRRFTASSR